MKERIAIRAQDPNAVSDGRWEIYLKQKERFKHPDELDSSELITINTDNSTITRTSSIKCHISYSPRDWRNPSFDICKVYYIVILLKLGLR